MWTYTHKGHYPKNASSTLKLPKIAYFCILSKDELVAITHGKCAFLDPKRAPKLRCPMRGASIELRLGKGGPSNAKVQHLHPN